MPIDFDKSIHLQDVKSQIGLAIFTLTENNARYRQRLQTVLSSYWPAVEVQTRVLPGRPWSRRPAIASHSYQQPVRPLRCRHSRLQSCLVHGHRA